MKVGIYCRLSEEDRHKKAKEDDSESIQNQKSMLLRYAVDNDWDIYNIYSDDDFAGADRNRPQWNRLLEDAEKRKFDIVLCKSQARFTREIAMVEDIIHGLLPELGIRFISIADNADTENEGNKKSRQINGLVNEWYIEDLSKNIKSVFDDKRGKGEHIGSFALYGYLKNPEQKGHLIIDEEAAEVVREVFTLYANGYGRTAIARTLNDRGVPNPTEYKRLKGVHYKSPKHKTGKLWQYYSITKMISNEMYIGTMVQGKYGSVSYKTKKNKPKPKESWFRVENTHEPIISRDLWDRVQELIQQNTKPFGTGEVGLFTQKARCMHCDASMRTSKNRSKYYLKCATKHVSRESCDGSFIPVAQLEQAVLSELRSLLENNLDKDEVERRIKLNDNFDKRLARLETQKAAYVKEIEACSKAVKESYKDKAKGLITEKEFIEFSRDFSADREKLEALVKSLETEIALLERKRGEVKTKKQIVDEYSDVKRLSRSMVERLIDYVSIGKRAKGCKTAPIEIYWNF